MKTAEEIFYSRNPTEIGEKYDDFKSTVLRCMKDYAEEALKEAAASTRIHNIKQSILNIIKELR